MAASLALLSLSPAASRHPHLHFSPCPATSASPLPPPLPPPPRTLAAAVAGASSSRHARSRSSTSSRPSATSTPSHTAISPCGSSPAAPTTTPWQRRSCASSPSPSPRPSGGPRPSGTRSSSRSSSAGTSTSAAVLVGFYRPADTGAVMEEDGGEVGEGEMACTAEVSFDATGAPGAPPTPTPPLEFPYICNMTVKTSFRRRGIGKQLLKACEDLVIKMDAKRLVYLHCRIIDQVPFNMYRTSGYNIVQTDSIFVWLSLQKRKHLMSKELAQASAGSEITAKDFDDNILTS